LRGGTGGQVGAAAGSARPGVGAGDAGGVDAADVVDAVDVAVVVGFDVDVDGAGVGDDDAASSPPELHAPRTSASASTAAGRRRTRATVGSASMGAVLTPVCVWVARPEVVVALDERFGEPVDAYVNGSQVWIRDDGPGDIALEWRLHPIAGFRTPEGVDTYALFAETAHALATGGEPPAPLARLWDGLEVFAAYGDEVEPATLAAACTEALGMAPDASGLVDHAAIGDEWERTGGNVSIVDSLLVQLGANPNSA
jgi:hypothetical protein